MKVWICAVIKDTLLLLPAETSEFSVRLVYLYELFVFRSLLITDGDVAVVANIDRCRYVRVMCLQCSSW